MKSSINIFHQSIEQSKHIPETPDEIFQSVKRVLKSQTDEIIRHRTGIYLVQYSETGPFQQKMDGWIPIKITRVTSWTSGGITEEEMKQFEEEN